MAISGLLEVQRAHLVPAGAHPACFSMGSQMDTQELGREKILVSDAGIRGDGRGAEQIRGQMCTAPLADACSAAVLPFSRARVPRGCSGSEKAGVEGLQAARTDAWPCPMAQDLRLSLRSHCCDFWACAQLKGSRHAVMKSGVLSQAKGSAYAELGRTKVLAAVYGPKPTDARKAFSEQGSVQTSVKFASFATAERGHVSRVRRLCPPCCRRPLPPPTCVQPA